MKQKAGILLLMFLLLACAGFIFNDFGKEPLITKTYTQMEVYMDDELVYETQSKEQIKHVIEKVNTESRRTTHEISLPAPEGRMVLTNNNDESVTFTLFGAGSVTIHEYLVETRFHFWKD